MHVIERLDTLIQTSPEIQPHRAALYRSTGPGYVLFKEFVRPDVARHMLQFWTKNPPPPSFFSGTVEVKTPGGTPVYVMGQPPTRTVSEARTFHRMFLWNEPVDEATHSTAVAVTLLRNQLEGAPLYRDLVPSTGRMTSFRIVISHNVEGVEVKEHRDWDPDSSRLQATLFLSAYGRDYTGDGHIFTTNQGKKVRFGPEIPVAPGDLAVWRYNNAHSIGSTRTPRGGAGFARIIFPPEQVTLPSAATSHGAGIGGRSRGAIRGIARRFTHARPAPNPRGG